MSAPVLPRWADVVVLPLVNLGMALLVIVRRLGSQVVKDFRLRCKRKEIALSEKVRSDSDGRFALGIS